MNSIINDQGELEEKSRWLRKEIFDMSMSKKKGHTPSSFSMVETLVTLFYRGFLKYDSVNIDNPNRDRLIISKGHGAMAAYPILADLGFFPKEELAKFTRRDGILRQYADNSIPGVECVTGSLGHGIGIATGFGLAAKQDGRNSKSYVIMSDGECYEGSVTEAARVTSHKSLDNVVGIIDRNRVCILGNTENLVKLEPMPMEDHWNSLGWYTQRVNGHSYGQLYKAFENAASNNGGRPSMIITDTVKGKGVIEMEGNINYHNKFPTEDKMQAFRRELDNPIDLR